MRTAGSLVFVALFVSLCFAQQIPDAAASVQQNHLPYLISASVPLYPGPARAAHIEGEVRLRITTDGELVSSIQTQSGHPWLVQAARENVKTWRFESHSPTAFNTVFRYKLLRAKCDSLCNCDSAKPGSVVLRLPPTEVEVKTKEFWICDPATELKK